MLISDKQFHGYMKYILIPLFSSVKKWMYVYKCMQHVSNFVLQTGLKKMQTSGRKRRKMMICYRVVQR